MNYSTTNSSGTSSVAPGVGHFMLFPASHGGGFVAFYALLKLIPTYIPGWGGSGFTLTGALYKIPVEKVNFKILQYYEIKREEGPNKTF